MVRSPLSCSFKLLALLLVLLFHSAVAFAQSLPQQKGLINDNENDFELGTIAQLGKLAETHKAKSANEIAIVTTASYAPYKNMEEYARQLASDLGIGQNKKQWRADCFKPGKK